MQLAMLRQDTKIPGMSLIELVHNTFQSNPDTHHPNNPIPLRNQLDSQVNNFLLYVILQIWLIIFSHIENMSY